MNIARFLNQTAVYEPYLSTDARDTPVYGAAQTVPCRLVEADAEKYAKAEDVHAVKTKVWLAFQPALKSLVAGRELVSSAAMVAVDGTTVGWVGVLR